MLFYNLIQFSIITAVVLLLTSCSTNDSQNTSTHTPPPPAASLDSMTNTNNSTCTSGYEIIKAMHAKYADKWYDKFSITQEVTYYLEGKEVESEIWNELISLPGKVRSNIGNPADGNSEIYLDGTFYIFKNHKLTNTAKQLHGVLLLGFDVYIQSPEITLKLLENDGYDLNVIHETTWQKQPVYVVGAQSGDNQTRQFWIDKERLLFVKLIVKTPSNNLIEIQFNKYQPFQQGWMATEVIFLRNGQKYTQEQYQDYQILDYIDPRVFDVENFTTNF